MKEPQSPRRGRPSSFDVEQALERAMILFWRHGYETTSMADLTAALETTPPTLYRVFGNKQQLFLKAVELYRGDPDSLAHQFSASTTSYEAAHMFMTHSARRFTGADTPAGCLIATSALTGSPDAREVQAHLRSIRVESQRMLAARIQRDIDEGILPDTSSAHELAALVMCTVQGMSTMARDGATYEALESIIQQVLSVWPTSTDKESP